MITRVQKWGNSQGLRFPKDILEKASISIGEDVEINVKNGEITVTPARRVRGRHRLKDLVAHMPRTYVVREEQWGGPQGKEIW
jgi:antitoxin MazE